MSRKDLDSIVRMVRVAAITFIICCLGGALIDPHLSTGQHLELYGDLSVALAIIFALAYIAWFFIIIPDGWSRTQAAIKKKGCSEN